MRIKVVLTIDKDVALSVSELYTTPNGYINRVLGENNTHHGEKGHSISSIQGGSMVDKSKGLIGFPNGRGWFYVSSNDKEFINDVEDALFDDDDCVVREGIKMDIFVHCEKDVNKYYDIVKTLSPILVSGTVDGNLHFYTLEDADYIDVLTQSTRRKLIASGIPEKTANGINIELCGKLENYKRKKDLVKIHNKFNFGSSVLLKVSGCKNARIALYNMGLGQSTGIGFGAVEQIEID